jgi:hypothetical protein
MPISRELLCQLRCICKQNWIFTYIFTTFFHDVGMSSEFLRHWNADGPLFIRIRFLRTQNSIRVLIPGKSNHICVFLLCNTIFVLFYRNKNRFSGDLNFFKEEFEKIHSFIKMIL